MQGEGSYSDQRLIFDEELFKIEGEQVLKSKIHRSIGALTFLNKNKSSGAGSGVLISKDLVLTSAHNIYDKMYQTENSGLKFYLGANGVAKEYYEVESWKYPEEFKDCKNIYKLEYDFALLKLKKPVRYDSYLLLTIPCETCLMNKNNQKFLQIFGFPVSYANFKPLDKYCNEMKLFQYGLAKKGRITTIQPNKFRIGYGISTLPGQSGCPVITNEMIIAIHSGGGLENDLFNIGRLITQEMLIFLEDWCSQMKGSMFKINFQNLCSHLSQIMGFEKIQQHKNTNEEDQKIFDTFKFQDDLAWFDKPKEQISHKSANTNHKNLEKEASKSQKLALGNKFAIKIQLNKKQLNVVDLTKNLLLIELSLDGNNLANIDLSHNNNLAQISLNQNLLTQINLGNNTNLIKISLNNNKLRNVNFENLIYLKELFLSHNFLENIQLSKNVILTKLKVDNNKLRSINLTKNVNLTCFLLENNQLKLISIKFTNKIPLQHYLDTQFLNISHQLSGDCAFYLWYKEKDAADCQFLKMMLYEKYMISDLNQYGCAYAFLLNRQLN